MDDGVEGFMLLYCCCDGLFVCYCSEICGVVLIDQLFVIDCYYINVVGCECLSEFFQMVDVFVFLIYGYIDSCVLDEYNMILLQNCVNVVVNVVVEVGVCVVDICGFGECNLCVMNVIVEGMQQNCCVEIYCLC